MLIPLEVEGRARAAGGCRRGRRAHPAPRRWRAGSAAGCTRAEHGGQGWTHVEWFLVEEQFGRSTNALSWHVPTAYNVLAHGIARADRPLAAAGAARRAARRLRGDRGARGLGPVGHRAPPRRATDGGWRIDGEKWFVTYGDVAAVYIVDGEARSTASAPTLFLVDARRCPGISVVDDPPFTHTYPHGHPTIRFDGVEVGDDAVIGGVGGGDELQRAWFVEERLGIAARGVRRDVAAARGDDRVGDRRASRAARGSSTTRASRSRWPTRAADAAAGPAAGARGRAAAPTRAPTRRSCTPRRRWRSCSCSEAAYRCADRAVQVFGGRGYMRTNVAERFLRELRVDRIWEGTSEIQRLIVARALERRGVERVLH